MSQVKPSDLWACSRPEPEEKPSFGRPLWVKADPHMPDFRPQEEIELHEFVRGIVAAMLLEHERKHHGDHVGDETATLKHDIARQVEIAATEVDRAERYRKALERIQRLIPMHDLIPVERIATRLADAGRIAKEALSHDR